MSRPETSLIPFWSIGVAGVLAGTGLLWSDSESPSATTTSPPKAPIPMPEPPSWEASELDRDADPVRVRYRAGSSEPVVVAAEHVARGARSNWQTRVRLEGMVDRTASHRSGETYVERRYRYRRARMQLLQDGRPRGGEALETAERTVEETTRRYRTDAMGVPSPERDETNPSALVSALIDASVELATPRLRTDAILPGETWSYRLPLRGVLGDEEAFGRGGVETQLEYVGLLERNGRQLAVFETAWTLDVRDRRAPNETEDVGARAIERQGHGDGAVLFDLEAGAIEASWLEVTYRSEQSNPAAGERRHEVRIYVGVRDDEGTD